MIQIITYDTRSIGTSYSDNDIVGSLINSPNSFDEFEINIIDLRSQYLWRNNDSDYKTVNCRNDFKSLKPIIYNSKRSDIIVMLPQNFEFRYYFYDRDFQRSIELKSMLNILRSDILNLLINMPCDLIFENTTTQVNDKCVKASFYFNIEQNILTKSMKSEKATTIRSENIILTTLDLNNKDVVFGFLEHLNILKKGIDTPVWFNEIIMFDDKEQNNVIDTNAKIIENSNIEINKANEKLNENNKYKSILYTQSAELVDVIFEILENILSCDLSTFVDNKKEDFLAVLKNITFIGEIKGINSNVRSANVSQLEVHRSNYLDGLQDDDRVENVKPLLIINHQRQAPLIDRQPIHETQIELAKKYGSLIIDTYTLLKVFEKFRNNELSTEDCIKLFSENYGYLKLDD